MPSETALESVYITEQPGEAITLYEGMLAVADKGKGMGSVSLRWLPSARLGFSIDHTVTMPTDYHFMLPLQVRLLDSSVSSMGRVTRTAASMGEAGFVETLSGILDPITVGDPAEIDRLLFHLPNFPSFVGGPIHRGEKPNIHSWVGRLRFEDDEWVVTIDPIPHHNELMKALSDEASWALTAVGEIRRMDGGRFSLDDAEGLLSDLRFFLSFLAGQWTQPCLLVGFNSGNKVCERWGSPIVQRWRGRLSAFPEHVRDGDRVREPKLDPVFRSFRRLGADPLWRDVLIWSLSWLIEASHAISTETTLALSQAGLELQAWSDLVLREQMSERKFKRLKARALIEHLLRNLGVSSHLPNGTIIDSMHDFARDRGVEGPEALTMVRNSVIHPKSHDKRPSADLRLEASRLSMWYLELALLRMVQYDDRYVNRLRSPYHPEPVPWSTNSGSAHD